ncbi:MAG: nodulation protein NfeD [Chlamydiota bacterium]|nr:nodulation protein NfeD [Chlamydiota bacterium]
MRLNLLTCKSVFILLILCMGSFDDASSSEKIPKIRIDGPINSVLSDIVVQHISEAEHSNAPFVLIQMDTPGGFDTAMRAIIEKILNCSIPVIVYVSPGGARAASAGFFILLSADIAVMAPGTNTGAAHPILALGGIVPLDTEKGGAKTLIEKAQNDALAYLRGIVGKRGRNIELAEKGVTESVSYTAEEALEGSLINFIANDEDDLLLKLAGLEVMLFNGKKVVLPEKVNGIETISLNWRQQLMLAISNPNLALILGLMGLLLLYMEFSHPGMIVPGVLGAISVLLALIGFSLLPINYVGVLLIILALGLFIAEIKVQGFGILGIGGIAAMLIGSLILIDAPQPELRISMITALGVVIPFAVIFMMLCGLVIRAHRKKIATGLESMIGMDAMCISDVGKRGKVYLRGEYWDAWSDDAIKEGTKVRIVEVNHLQLKVEEIKEGERSL